MHDRGINSNSQSIKLFAVRDSKDSDKQTTLCPLRARLGSSIFESRDTEKERCDEVVGERSSLVLRLSGAEAKNSDDNLESIAPLSRCANNQSGHVTSSRDSKRLIGTSRDREREKKAVRRTLRTRRRFACTRSLSITIMAWVWWCNHLDNCVQVAAQNGNCPSVCDCYNSETVMCESKGLRTLPPHLPVPAKLLNLASNNIMEVRKNAFRSLKSLNKLWLNSNKIRDLQLGAFAGLSNLMELDLSDNKLRDVPQHALSHLQNLKTLKLRNNPIKQILAFNFVPVKTLNILDIGELRMLTYVNEDGLRGMTVLEELKMDSCSLETISFLRPLDNLRIVNLDSNKLKEIGTNSFYGLNKLTEISLALCDIANIKKSAFKYLRLLEKLDLSNNNLSSVNVDVFPTTRQMKTLQLGGNPWLCNCDLQPLARYLKDRRVCTADGCGQCAHPTDYSKLPLTNFTEIEQPPCAALIVRRASQVSVNVSEGDPVKVPCPTKGEASPDKVDWYSPGGQSITSGNYKVTVKIIGGGILNFTHVTLEDKGVYKCSVTRSGETSNATVFINVTQASYAPTRTSFITTETTVIKTTDSVMPVQNPAPPVVTRPETETTGRDTARWTQRQTNGQSTSSTSAADTSPFLTGPTKTWKNYITTSDKNSEVQITDYTTVYVVCFVALAVLAAILLFAFHKCRKAKAKNNERNRNRENVQEKGNGRVLSGNSRTKMNLISHDVCRNMMGDNENPALDPSNMQTSSASPNTAPSLANSDHATWTAKSPRLLTETAINTFVLPPAAFRGENEQSFTIQAEEARASSTTYAVPSARGVRRDGLMATDVPRDKASTLPQKGAAGTLNMDTYSRELLRSFATSCQEVAQQRKIQGCPPERHKQQTKAWNAENGASWNQNNSRITHHMSCGNLKNSSFLRYPQVDADITAIGDVDFTTGPSARGRAMERKTNVVNRQKPVRMRSAEGVLHHKETAI